ncbi:MAG TPA: hypothetical protein VMX58_11850 [Patescibacteria group bacterium]|nr:hypothetical protein [Patescibacteria group bacterium]
MKKGLMVRLIACTALIMLFGCSGKQAEEQEILYYPLDSVEDIITRSSVTLDTEITSDGNGSIRIDAGGPAIVRLVETGDIDVENAKLIYRAKLRTENVKGKAYLEMYCRMPGVGEAFSRGLDSPLSGTNEWVTEEIPFYLKKGQNPDNVKLNLMIDGSGTVWIDDIHILRAPLP